MTLIFLKITGFSLNWMYDFLWLASETSGIIGLAMSNLASTTPLSSTGGQSHFMSDGSEELTTFLGSQSLPHLHRLLCHVKKLSLSYPNNML